MLSFCIVLDLKMYSFVSKQTKMNSFDIKNIYARKLILLIISIHLALFLSGQENNSTDTKTDTTSLSGKIEEVTVTAFRTPYNLFNTPAPVNLITTVQLASGSALTPVEALNQIPGVLMHHGTLNTNRLTIRGIGSRTPYATNKIKAYFGEIPLTSGDGETTLEDLENPAISRVEIIKGPASSLFGAGLGGVILFQPKTVATNFVENRTTLASFGTVKNSLSAGIIHNDLNIYALGSWLKSDGFRKNNTTNRGNLLLHSNYSFSENTNLQVLLKATKMKAFIPSSLDWPTFQESPEQAASNWGGISGYEDYFTGQFGLSFNIFTNRKHKISVATFGSFRNADELRPFNKLEEQSDYIGARGYIQKTISGENAELTLTSGVEFFREKYDWATISNEAGRNLLSDNREKRSYENLFFQAESNFNDLFYLSAGINGNLTRFDYNDQFTSNGDQSGNYSYKPVISPRIGFNYVIVPGFSFFGNLSHGFSTPTFEETLLPAGEINKDIKPETGWNAEAGLRTVIDDRLTATLSYYRIYVKNLLVARRTGQDAYIGVNAGESLHPGLEAAFRLIILERGNYPLFSINGNATIANYHFREFVDDGTDYSGNLLPGTTKNTWLLAANFGPVENLNFHAWHRHTGKMPVNDANSDFTNPYGLTNFEVTYNNNFSKLNLELKAGVENIFDVHYASMLAVNAPAFGGNLPRYYYPGNPRNYFVSVLIGWK
jgi:iron complex outermembrane receptor protein